MVVNKVFLDTNKIIDIFEPRGKGRLTPEMVNGMEIHISPLSIHVLCYIGKYKIPSEKLERIEDYYKIVDFDEQVLSLALNGPTNDLEDNIQLHSAAQSGCDIFLTDDEKLLKMAYFGKVKIVNKL